jgi:hypothetical protein
MALNPNASVFVPRNFAGSLGSAGSAGTEPSADEAAHRPRVVLTSPAELEALIAEAGPVTSIQVGGAVGGSLLSLWGAHSHDAGATTCTSPWYTVQTLPSPALQLGASFHVHDSHVQNLCVAFGKDLRELRLGSSDTGESRKGSDAPGTLPWCCEQCLCQDH